MSAQAKEGVPGEIAAASMAASLPLFWLDWSHGGEIVLATVIGINLVAASLRFLFWGLGALDERHERNQRPA